MRCWACRAGRATMKSKRGTAGAWKSFPAEEQRGSLLWCSGKTMMTRLPGELEPPSRCRRLALQLHPDKNRAAGAEEAFKVASKAFDTLSDPQARKHQSRSETATLSNLKRRSDTE